MIADFLDLITALDGTQFVGLCLIVLWVSVAAAAQIAKRGQVQAVARTNPASSNRKAGRTR